MKKPKQAKSQPEPQTVSPPPSNEEIALVAYSIWEQEGQPDGRDVEHWFMAEMQIRQRQSQVVPPAESVP